MAGPLKESRYDVVVVGGGHNGLVAAAYAAKAGLSVVVLERLGRTGGAAVSYELFPGVPAKISPYAHLVGLFPEQVVKDLGVDVQLRARRTASYTPVIRNGRHTGLMVERSPGQQTEDSFKALTGSDREYHAWRSFYGRVGEFSEVLAPTMLEPLRTKKAMQELLDPSVWDDLVEHPLGQVIERTFADDIVRGVVATDGLIGTFADLHDPGLEPNRCMLYHMLGHAGGEWRIPLGGMGALTASLERAVWRHGGELVTQAFVTRVETNGSAARITFQHDGEEHHVECGWVLGNVAPWVMQLLLGDHPGPRPEGSQLQVDMVLDRLPRLRSGVSPPMAFAGTVHVAESYDQLQQAFLEAQEGFIPEVPPGELLCHSLTDPSVLGPLAMEGKHVFTYFGVQSPARLFSGHVEAQRDEIVLRVLDAINVYLEEPLEALVSLDRDGNPCLVAKAPQDVESQLAMPGGHIYHGPLSWPWAQNRASLDTPAERWGVHTALPNVLLCGAGAVRGGAVSGIAGHNAAMAVIEATGRADQTDAP
jgi:phytoene dehydrogenase-like protein